MDKKQFLQTAHNNNFFCYCTSLFTLFLYVVQIALFCKHFSNIVFVCLFAIRHQASLAQRVSNSTRVFFQSHVSVMLLQKSKWQKQKVTFYYYYPFINYKYQDGSVALKRKPLLMAYFSTCRPLSKLKKRDQKMIEKWNLFEF